jgi:hypothetical protein
MVIFYMVIFIQLQNLYGHFLYSHCILCQAVLLLSHVQNLSSSDNCISSSDCTTQSWTYCWNLFFNLGRDSSHPEIFFYLNYTVMLPGPVQEVVGGAGFELQTDAFPVWCQPMDLTH